VVDEALIERAGRILAEAASSSARVILFGSAARQDAGADSDIDFLVV
jgi:predicted nucleotidyltransferase